MQFPVILRILGLFLMTFSLTMVPPIVVSLIYRDGTWPPFTIALAFTLILGFLIWRPTRSYVRELRVRDGFLVVVLFWSVLGLVGAVPLALSNSPQINFTDALFESLSGLTTTGATVLIGLDELPKSIQFYRQQLQWFGGMGIIVLAVAIMPMLGVGGMQLYRAETPGPIKDNKLTPRITETAKALWYIYLGLTLSCAAAYWLAGMSLFDAICHSFSTVAIGGFSTHDASLGYFDNNLIYLVAILFMFLSGVNFSLHFLSFRSRRLAIYISDPEFRTYALLLGSATLFVSAALYLTKTHSGLDTAFIQGMFHVVSLGTTTGFTTDTFYAWPGLLPVLLLFTSFAGGCAGSTGGGIKIIRVLLLLKQGLREINHLIHPNAALSLKIGNKSLPESVMNSVWGFFAAYIMVFGVIMFMLLATGVDQVTAFSAVAACLNNLGPGLGEVSSHYGELNNASKWLLSIAMLFGRLEIFTILVLLSPNFWRR